MDIIYMYYEHFPNVKIIVYFMIKICACDKSDSKLFYVWCIILLVFILGVPKSKLLWEGEGQAVPDLSNWLWGKFINYIANQ